MFSGIVEEKGTICKIEKRKNLLIMTLAANKVTKGTKVGDSICVDGVCLTVVELKDNEYRVTAIQETLDKNHLNKSIPANETVLTLEMGFLGKKDTSNNSFNVEHDSKNLKIDMASSSDIYYRGKILDFISSIGLYFKNLYNNTLNI